MPSRASTFNCPAGATPHKRGLVRRVDPSVMTCARFARMFRQTQSPMSNTQHPIFNDQVKERNRSERLTWTLSIESWILSIGLADPLWLGPVAALRGRVPGGLDGPAHVLTGPAKSASEGSGVPPDHRSSGACSPGSPAWLSRSWEASRESDCPTHLIVCLANGGRRHVPEGSGRALAAARWVEEVGHRPAGCDVRYPWPRMTWPAPEESRAQCFSHGWRPRGSVWRQGFSPQAQSATAGRPHSKPG